MKQLKLILLFFIAAIQINAQDTGTEQLQKISSAHPPQDTFRVNRLINLTSVGRPLKEREKFAAEALSVSRKINHSIGEGYALPALGYAVFLLGDKEQGNLLLVQADSIAKRSVDARLIGYGGELSL